MQATEAIAPDGSEIDEGERAVSGHAELLGGAGDGGGALRRPGLVDRIAAQVREDPMLALTLLGVAVGVLLGLALAAVLPGEEDETGTRETVVKLVAFPGSHPLRCPVFAPQCPAKSATDRRCSLCPR